MQRVQEGPGPAAVPAGARPGPVCAGSSAASIGRVAVVPGVAHPTSDAEAGVHKIRWLAELGAPTIHLSIGAERLSVEASRVCVLTDPADGLEVIAQHSVEALTAAHRRRPTA